MKVTIYTDGSARCNPNGPGGYGCILQYYRKSSNVLYEKELSAGYKKTTNNRMELMGVIVGLESLKTSCDVEVISDSQYVVNAFNKNWLTSWMKNGWRTSSKTEVKNTDLWKRLLLAVQKQNSVKFTWVEGHAITDGNNRCDKLATQAADGKFETLLDDKEIIC